MLALQECWPQPSEVPYDDYGEPVPGPELEAWAVIHAAACHRCRQLDFAVLEAA